MSEDGWHHFSLGGLCRCCWSVKFDVAAAAGLVVVTRRKACHGRQQAERGGWGWVSGAEDWEGAGPKVSKRFISTSSRWDEWGKCELHTQAATADRPASGRPKRKPGYTWIHVRVAVIGLLCAHWERTESNEVALLLENEIERWKRLLLTSLQQGRPIKRRSWTLRDAINQPSNNDSIVITIILRSSSFLSQLLLLPMLPLLLLPANGRMIWTHCQFIPLH